MSVAKLKLVSKFVFFFPYQSICEWNIGELDKMVLVAIKCAFD